jgi:hypothetical protein
MSAILLLFSPELLVISILLLAAFVFLLLHIRPLIRNTLAIAALLFAWAVEVGFVGFIAYLAAWVFMFPVMVAICLLGGVVRTIAEASVAREARKQARTDRRAVRLRQKERRANLAAFKAQWDTEHRKS